MSTHATHTPGPWHVGKDGDVWNKSNTVCVAMIGADILDGEANARLIAAAPELLAACEALVERAVNLGITLEPLDDPELISLATKLRDGIVEARAVIAKARGEG